MVVPVGAGLAREDGVLGDIILRLMVVPVGAELARDGGSSVSIDAI